MMNRLPRLASLVLLSSVGAACTDPLGTTAGTTSSTSGVIYKGPMEEGASVTLQPLADDLFAVGDPVSTWVLDNGGEFDATVEHHGLVLITSEGAAFNEAFGGLKAEERVVLSGYGVLGDVSRVNVNLLTDLTRVRVHDLLLDGLTWEIANDQAVDELHGSLPLGDRDKPGLKGSEIDLTVQGYDQAWVFALSAIVTEAAAGDGVELDDLMARIREGFAAEGAVSLVVHDQLRDAERRVNPDLAMLGLQAHIEDYGLDYAVPDLNTVLDTDGDGIVNSDDNCPYTVNPAQTLASGAPFGMACDQRLLDLATSDVWGCAVRAVNGSLACWLLDGAKTGGTPPNPQIFPAAPVFPWGTDDRFDGVYTEVALGQRATDPDHWFCLNRSEGNTTCWDQADPAPIVDVGARLTDLQMSGDMVCGLDGDSAVCVGRDLTPGPEMVASSFTVAGAGALCGLSGGVVSCIDDVGVVDFGGAFVGLDLDRISASHFGDGAHLCGLLAGSGEIVCAEEGATPATAPPPGGGWVELAVGRGVVCASDGEGHLACGRQPEVCPEHEPPPPGATGLVAGECTTCGLDGLGVGICWPRNWYRLRGEGVAPGQ